MPYSTFPLLCVLGLVALSSTCYIQNCPRGGKRSFPDLPRQCMSCGPGDRGRCFGPSICCGEGMGCYVGSAEAAGCVEENYLPSPARLEEECVALREAVLHPGSAVTQSCVLDPDCLEDSKRQPPSEQNAPLMGGLTGDLLRILHATSRGDLSNQPLAVPHVNTPRIA